MADNTTLPGTGDVIATEDISGVKYQLIKLVDSTDGSNSPIGVTENPIKVLDEHSGSLLHLILKTLLSPFGYDKALARYRQTAVIESGTVTTVTTVTTASNLVNIDGRNGAMLVNTNSRAAWAMSHRSRIT